MPMIVRRGQNATTRVFASDQIAFLHSHWRGVMERRLAAILSADVVGYSLLMGQDEAGTLQALKAIRSDVIDPMIAEHKGRVFKSTGDGVLAEFPSVVNAVACAVAVQRAMSARNTDI